MCLLSCCPVLAARADNVHKSEMIIGLNRHLVEAQGVFSFVRLAIYLGVSSLCYLHATPPSHPFSEE